MKIHLLISAHNAAGTLESVFQRIPKRARGRIDRCIVVNDGSIDGTEGVLDRLLEDEPDLVRLRHTSSHGHGAACKTLIGCAVKLGADAAVIVGADGRHPPEMLPGLLDSLENGGADVIQASRVSDRDEAGKVFPGAAMLAYSLLNSFEKSSFHLNLDDFHSGFSAYTRRAMDTVPYQSLSDTSSFSFEFLLMASRAGLRLRELPVPMELLGGVAPLYPMACASTTLRLLFSRIRGRSV